MYRRGTERKQQRLVVEEMEGQMGRVFSDYWTPLTLVSLFQYLVLTLSYSNGDWLVVERNLRRAQGKWERLVNILGRERADMRTVGSFMLWWYMWCFFCVVDVVSDPLNGESPRGFHHRVVRRMAGMGPKHQ